MKNETEITIAYVALERAEEVSVSERRTATQSTGRLEPLKVRSAQTEDEYVPLVEDINMGRFELRGVTPVLQSEADTSVPPLPEQDRLEIDFRPVQILAIVRTRENRLVLADLGEGEVDLPQDARLLGILPAPGGTFEVTAYDSLTDEDNKLGYHFNGTVPGTWVDLAQRKREAALAKQRRERAEGEQERRQAEELAEQKAKAAQRREAEAKPVEIFTTSDPEVAVRLSETYRPALVRLIKSGTTYRIEDYEGLGNEITGAVQNERQELRKQNMDPDKVFAKRREEHAEILAGRNS